VKEWIDASYELAGRGATGRQKSKKSK
jgi:hypothetical protein